MSLATEQATDAGKIFLDTGVTVTFGVQTATCGLTKMRRSMDMEDAGYLSEIDAEILTVLANWSTAPVTNDKITIAGVSYRVLGRDDSVNGILSTMQLARVN